ncbi:hypothetical protein A4H34_00710 [Peptidiphaga gingivicola]|uniref:THAP4-like heme-binding domain-containing protein n=1 Tax=Peptidiphaga gingivicola TaxID=2741497 RepID=A0A179B406_9ACTO|nr:FABP family protein [Peptidiphaga gingivicola]OAP85754.1 hypothetical protein A4H34_00710 [Peptidiphaga gingivicola]
MVFSIPEGLAPETYPMAWIVGSWKGAGVLEYEGVEASAYLHELTVDNDDGGPCLRIESQVWLAQEEAGAVDREEPGLSAYSRLTKDSLWTRSSGFVRAAPGTEKHDGATVLEAVSANPAGHAITWAGLIDGPRLQFAADAIASVPTAAAFEGAKIVAGLVQSDLFYAYDIAAFGHEMRTYMAGRLSRDEG